MDSYLGRSSDGWSLDTWNKSANQGEKPTDWPDNQTNSVFNFDDRDKSMKKQDGACVASKDCGSGFGCVGGYCIKIDQRQATNGPNNATSPGSNCDIEPPYDGGGGNDPCGGAGGGGSGSVGCGTSGCGASGGSGGGGGSGGEEECCGGPIYRRYGAGGSQQQCEPFDPPSGCSKYCTSYWRNNGEYADGCNQYNTCSECSNCLTQTGTFGNTACEKRTDGACYCPGSSCGTATSGKGACYSCEKEGSLFGICRLTCKNCVDRCNCFWRCPCGTEITQNWTQKSGHCFSGPGCATACRADLSKKCGKFCPPPPLDPCADDPNDGCGNTDCYCTTQYKECGDPGSPPAPSGCTKKVFGFISTCGALQSPDPDGVKRTAWLMKFCCKPPENSNCLCRNPETGKRIRSCPECQKCNSEGRCVPDDSCDDVCESGVVCAGECCEAGETCRPKCSYTIVDACHGAGGSFTAPCGAVTLSRTATINADEAVCSRYHTHCSVRVGGKARATHLDCQAGVRSNGPTGGTICGV